MLGRAHRFHGINALNGTYKRGKTVRSPMISLRYASRNPAKPYRVAVVVSRKVNKSAVVRNRIRRRVYAAVRDVERERHGGINPGTDLVFTVFSDQAAYVPAGELKSALDGLLGKAASEHR